MSSGVTEFLVQLIATEGTNMMTPALRILGNFVSGNDMHTQAVIDAGFFTHADMLLNHPKKNVRKETCWVLSNIAAGTPDQISQLLKNREELNSLINLAEHSEWDVRKEAVWTISNIATGGTDEHVHALVELDGIDALCSVLTVSDPKIIEVALDAIENILKIGQKSGKAYDTFVDECDGLEGKLCRVIQVLYFCLSLVFSFSRFSYVICRLAFVSTSQQSRTSSSTRTKQYTRSPSASSNNTSGATMKWKTKILPPP